MSLWSLALVTTLVAMQPAGPPEQRVATLTGPNEVTLTWKAQPGVREYEIYSDFQGALRPTLIGRVSGTGNRYVVTIPASFTSVKSGAKGKRRVEFWIGVVADGAKRGERFAFNPIEIVVAEVPRGQVKAPRRVQAVEQSGSVTITWDRVPDATGYAIIRRTGRSGYTMLCASCPAEPSYVDRQPVLGTTNVYEVMTVAANGRSRPQPSNGVKVKPPPTSGDPKGPGGSGSRGSGSGGPAGPGGGGIKGSPGPLAAPANARATLSNGIVRLSWTPVREARAYAINRNGQRAANLGASAKEWSEGVGRFAGELQYEIVAISMKETSRPARFNPIVLPRIKAPAK